MDQLRAIRYFSKVAQTGSFTQAAKTFCVPPSSLSRRVADLEASLGATLLKRTTRTVQLTEVGQLYYQQVQDILRQLTLCDETVRSYQAKPMGQLRVSVLSAFGERLVLPLLDEFTRLYPDIVLDVSLSDVVMNLGQDDVDIAIRGGGVPNERIQAIQLMDNEFIPVAAPSYLKEMGTPTSVFELSEHRGIFYRTPMGPSPWLCEVDGAWHEVSGHAVAVSNHSGWLTKLVLAGRGIMMAPRWSMQAYLDCGALQALSFNNTLRVTPHVQMSIYLLYQKPQYIIPKVKAAVDFFVERLKKP